MNQIEIPFNRNQMYLTAAFGAFIILIVVLMAFNFRVLPAPPTTVNVNEVECVDLSSGMHMQDGWKRVHAADEQSVISQTLRGQAEWKWIQSEQCWEASRPTNRFLLNNMWWRSRK